MSVELKWLGHASFRIAGAEGVLYIDPWKLAGEPHDADVVFVSHSHYDHCSGPDIAKVSKDDTVILAPSETIEQLHAANAVDPGEQIYVKDISVEAVPAYNVGRSFHPRAKNWVGAVFTIDARRIYYAGDTDLIPEMATLGDIDVALLPVGGTYTLDAEMAAKACQSIRCKAAVPYHWGDIIGTQADAEKLARLVACCKVHILQPGESMTVA